jgi:hypothetical protein
MTEHDRVRMQRALDCDMSDLESVADAVRGLQSTDDPSLVPLRDALMKQYRRLRTKGLRLMATFRPQAWINNYAVDIDGAVTFDATDALLTLDLEGVRTFREHSEQSDRLADDLPARQVHSGPFEVDVDIDDWLDENGFEGGRNCLTDEVWRSLQERFRA